jgi:hypothetical protein
MEPGIPAGCTVEVAPRPRYWPGDVLAFRGRDGQFILHRLIGWRRRSGRWHFVTLADAARRPDPPLAPEHILGRAAVPVPVRRRILAGLRFLALSGRWMAARLRIR